jgi:osmotically-inducible protein OsmY
MRKLLLLVLLGVGALMAYNYNEGHDPFHLPGTSAAALRDTARDRVSDAVRETVTGTVRETREQVEARAKAGVQKVANRAETAVETATMTSKIKAKMALDDVVRAADVDVDTDGTVVTLTGDLGSAEERRRALRIATETDGVTKVVDRLRVR